MLEQNILEGYLRRRLRFVGLDQIIFADKRLDAQTVQKPSDKAGEHTGSIRFVIEKFSQSLFPDLNKRKFCWNTNAAEYCVPANSFLFDRLKLSPSFGFLSEWFTKRRGGNDCGLCTSSYLECFLRRAVSVSVMSVDEVPWV